MAATVTEDSPEARPERGLYGRGSGLTDAQILKMDASRAGTDPMDQAAFIKNRHDTHVRQRDGFISEARLHDSLSKATLQAEARVRGIGAHAAKKALLEVRIDANAEAVRANMAAHTFDGRRETAIEAASQHLQENFGAYEDAAINDLAETGRSTSYGQNFTPPQQEQ